MIRTRLPFSNSNKGASDRVVAGKRSDRPVKTHILRVRVGRGDSLSARRSSATKRGDVDTAARGVDTLGTGASSHHAVKGGLVPAVDEVTVQPVSSGVTHSPDELVEVSERRGVVEELVEDGVDGDGVGLRAVTTVVRSDGEGHLS